MHLRPPVAWGLLQALLVLAAATVVSVGTLSHGFVFDDHMLLGGNAPVILGQAPLSSALTYRYWGAADEASPNELYRPITIISLGLNARLLGTDPWGMHAGNVFLHAINALLVYVMVRLLFGRATMALLTSLIFAVHPIATEAVSAVAGRADLLATALLLSASLLGIAACRHQGAWRYAGGIGVALATFMGVLSKESVFAAPLVMTAVLGADSRRHDPSGKARRPYLLAAATLVSIQGFSLLMALLLRVRILGYLYRAMPPDDPSTAYLAFVNNPLQLAEPLGRVLTALRVAVMGAGLLVVPYDLTADYSFNQITVTQGWPGLADFGALLFLALYLALVYFSARRSSLVMLALAWPALTYLLVSNLIFPIGTIFGERLLYLPSIGYAMLLAAGIARLWGERPWRRLAVSALTAVVVAGYGARFMARAADWVDDDHLFRATVASSPASAKAHSNYGFTLQRAGRLEEAAAEYRAALAIAPGLTGSGVSLARCLMALGKTEEAVEEYGKVIERDNGISVAWSGLGVALEAAGRHEEAEKALRRALELSMGGSREASRGLAAVMLATGREREAVDLLERLVKSAQAGDLIEDLSQAHYQLGVRHLKDGRPEDFIAEMRRTVELDPEHGPARYNLALDALERGAADEARQHALAALKAGYELPAGFLEACGLTAVPPPPGPIR